MQGLRVRAVLSLPRSVKSAVSAMADAIAGCLAVLIALFFVSGYSGLSDGGALIAVCLVVSASLPVFNWLLGAYRSVTRFLHLASFFRLSIGVLLSATLLFGAVGALSPAFSDWRVAVAFFIFANTALAAWRILATRMLLGWRPEGAGKPVAIYGAGSAGQQLLAALRRGGEYRPVAFLDDDPQFWGNYISGVPVINPSHLTVLREKRVDLVLLAMPSVTRARKRQIVDKLSEMSLQAMVMPGLNELADGRKRVDELREVQIEDLLGRDAVPPDAELLNLQTRGKVVLVTGAGGSIGSELARQVVSLEAAKVLLLDISEFSLYEIERQIRQELANQASSCKVIPILGNVCDERHMRAIFSEHKVDTVYHSAAYKHVPLVEANAIAAAHNNINGTECTARTALQAGVHNFVLVSTDKAVRPTSVMGATKRFCELVVQGLAAQFSDRSVSIVRFGNVLGSSGSVVPLFREQIRSGLSLTVTHPEVTRYFMTIPEAACLVIQAGAMGARGEVFVLDMGEPVKIRDLAERMVRLCGLTLREEGQSVDAGDISLVYTGLRPGEKLYEELLIGSNPEATTHKRIMKANETALEPHAVSSTMHRIRQAVEWRNTGELLLALNEAVAGYSAKQASAVGDNGSRSSALASQHAEASQVSAL